MIDEDPVIELLTAEILVHTGGFILKQSSTLGVDDLGNPATDSTWQPYLGAALSVDIQRGGRPATILDEIQVGTMTLVLKDTGDPAAGAPIRPKSKIRIRSTVSPFRAVFTGWIEDVDTRYFYDRREKRIASRTTIVAVDAIKDLSNRTLVMEPSELGAERWENRISRIAREFNSPAILPGVTTSDYRLADYPAEATLAEHLTLACNSIGAYWWVDRDGMIRFAGVELTTDPRAALFSDHAGGPRLLYREPTTSYNTRSVVNDLDVTNHSEGIEERYRLYDETSAATWGLRSESVTFCIYDEFGWEGSARARGSELMAGRRDPRPYISAIEWNAQEQPATAEQLDIYSRIEVEFGTLAQNSRVIGISHKITPSRWLVTLTIREVNG